MKKEKKSSVQKVIKNSVFNSSAWVVTLALNILFLPFIVDKLTVEGYGIYALLTSIVGYYNLFDLGLGQGVIKYVAEYKTKKDFTAINRSINAALWVQLITGFFCSLFLLIFADNILSLLKVSPDFLDVAKNGLHICTVGFFFTFLSGTLISVLMGLQRYDLSSLVNVSTNFFLILFTLILLFAGAGLREVILLHNIFAFLSFIVCLIIVSKQLPLWRFSFKIDIPYFKKLFNFSFYLFIGKISGLFSNYIVRFIISAFLGPKAVTYYVVPQKIITAFGGLLSNASTVLFPYTSELSAENNFNKIQETFIKTSRMFAAISVPVFLAISVFAKPFLIFWMGKDFLLEVGFVLNIIALSTILGSSTTVPNLMTMGCGYSKIIGTFSIITVIICTISLPLFTKLWGIEGTAVAMLIARIPGCLMIIYVCKYVFHLSIKDYIKKVFGFHFYPFLIAIMLFICIENFLMDFPSYVFLIFACLLSALYFYFIIKHRLFPIEKILEKLKIKKKCSDLPAR